MNKVFIVSLRYSSAVLLGYFGINVAVEALRDRQVDYLESIRIHDALSAIVGGATAALALYFVFVLLTRAERASFVVQMSLGLVMLFAGMSKIFEPGGARDSILGYRLGFSNTVATILGYAMPIGEIIIGFMLLTGIYARLAAWASSLLMVIFIIAIVQVWARGYSIDCGCFGNGGNLDPEGRHLRYTLEVLRDIVFAAMGMLIARSSSPPFTLIPDIEKD